MAYDFVDLVQNGFCIGDLCAFMRLNALDVSGRVHTSEDRKETLSGLEEMAARTPTGAKRPKFLMSDPDSRRESLRNFSEA